MLRLRAVRLTRRSIACVALAASIITGGCRTKPGDEAEPAFEPIPVHVKNENFLDMNVFAVIGGVSRRLGTVTGNSASDFVIPPSFSNGQSVAITAIPIGGSGAASSGQLNVGSGQMIDFRIAPLLRQSSASVHEP